MEFFQKTVIDEPSEEQKEPQIVEILCDFSMPEKDDAADSNEKNG